MKRYIIVLMLCQLTTGDGSTKRDDVLLAFLQSCLFPFLRMLPPSAPHTAGSLFDGESLKQALDVLSIVAEHLTAAALLDWARLDVYRPLVLIAWMLQLIDACQNSDELLRSCSDESRSIIEQCFSVLNRLLEALR